MLPCREAQLAKAEAEVRKLRRRLGLDDPTARTGTPRVT